MTRTEPSLERPSTVYAVIVTFHPDDGFTERFDRILAEVGGAVIIDNGSAAPAVTMLRRLASSRTRLIENGSNQGIACALNTGVRYALAAGSSWALLLDQDTTIDAGLVEHLLEAAREFPDASKLAVVGCAFNDRSGRPAQTLMLDTGGPTWREVESVITSGSLLCLAAYADVGPFRDEFFIDYVDMEFCWRARVRQYHIIQTRKALMTHSVGAQRSHRMLGGRKWTTHHSAERRYYIARNGTVLLREQAATRAGSWRWKSLVRCFRLCKRIALFETDKRAKIAAVVEGWRDALRGRMGPRPRRRP